MRLVALGVAAVYVLALYATSDQGRRRDDIRVVRKRIAIAIATSLLVLIWTPALCALVLGVPQAETRAAMQLQFEPKAVMNALLQTAVLFAGPIAYRVRNASFEPLLSLHGIRDFCVGPVSEEIVYRSAIFGIYSSSNISSLRVAIESAVYFAFAHVHHGIVDYINNRPLGDVLISCCVHSLITFIFGLYAANIFRLQGSVWAAAAAHSLCNYIGPPPLTGPRWYMVTLVGGLCGWIYMIR